MQLTLFSDYSLRILLYLAAHPGERVALPEISAAYGISQHHLVKVVQLLLVEGWIERTRGRGGGLTLAVPPSTVPNRIPLVVVRKIPPGTERATTTM